MLHSLILSLIGYSVLGNERNYWEGRKNSVCWKCSRDSQAHVMRLRAFLGWTIYQFFNFCMFLSRLKACRSVEHASCARCCTSLDVQSSGVLRVRRQNPKSSDKVNSLSQLCVLQITSYSRQFAECFPLFLGSS